MRSRFAITLLVIVRSLFPTSRRAPLTGCSVRNAPAGYTQVPPEDIPLYLADFGRAAGNDGKLALFFPGCATLAAPFLLFRLKREGYSGCRAIATGDGLLIEAIR